MIFIFLKNNIIDVYFVLQMSEEKNTDENNICIICHDESNVDDPLYKMKCCQAHYHLTCFNEDIDYMSSNNQFECRYCRQKMNTPKNYALKKRDVNTNKLHLLTQLFLKINSMINIIFSVYSIIDSSIKLIQKTTSIWSILLILFFIYSNYETNKNIYDFFILNHTIKTHTNVDIFTKYFCYFILTIGNINIVSYLITEGYKTVNWEYNFLISPIILTSPIPLFIFLLLHILLFVYLLIISLKGIYIFLHDTYYFFKDRKFKFFLNYWTHEVVKDWEGCLKKCD